MNVQDVALEHQNDQKKGIKAPPLLASGQISIQDQNKLNFTLTQEEYAHDVSFTSHESPSLEQPGGQRVDESGKLGSRPFVVFQSLGTQFQDSRTCFFELIVATIQSDWISLGTRHVEINQLPTIPKLHQIVASDISVDNGSSMREMEGDQGTLEYLGELSLINFIFQSHEIPHFHSLLPNLWPFRLP
jgi:hypothetical protein